MKSYSREAAPTPGFVLAMHEERFGTPQWIKRLDREGITYFELSGFPHARIPLLALPSSPPAYVYNTTGELVDWCLDPGDMPDYYQKWGRHRQEIGTSEDLPEELNGMLNLSAPLKQPEPNKAQQDRPLNAAAVR